MQWYDECLLSCELCSATCGLLGPLLFCVMFRYVSCVQLTNLFSARKKFYPNVQLHAVRVIVCHSYCVPAKEDAESPLMAPAWCLVYMLPQSLSIGITFLFHCSTVSLQSLSTVASQYLKPNCCCAAQGFLASFQSVTENAATPSQNISAVLYQLSGSLTEFIVTVTSAGFSLFCNPVQWLDLKVVCVAIAIHLCNFARCHPPCRTHIDAISMHDLSSSLSLIALNFAMFAYRQPAANAREDQRPQPGRRSRFHCRRLGGAAVARC